MNTRREESRLKDSQINSSEVSAPSRLHHKTTIAIVHSSTVPHVSMVSSTDPSLSVTSDVLSAVSSVPVTLLPVSAAAAALNTKWTMNHCSCSTHLVQWVEEIQSQNVTSTVLCSFQCIIHHHHHHHHHIDRLSEVLLTSSLAGAESDFYSRVM